MNTNDLPPAARLAALIEAGRAAHPNLKHSKGLGMGEETACALEFACLGAGLGRPRFTSEAARRLGLEFRYAYGMPGHQHNLAEQVVWDNDHGKSLDEILQSLREGELAKLAA